MEKSEYIFGLRAIIEAIDAGKQIDKVLIKKDLTGDLAKELLNKIKEYDIVCQRVPVERLNRITMKNHQGAIAILTPIVYHKLETLLPSLFEEGKNPKIILLDGVTDIRNFGAIARSAECAGFDAIVIPVRNSVSVNGDAVKTSAGALLHIPVCREASIKEVVTYLRESGCCVIGASEKSKTDYSDIDYTVPVAIVMGAEDVGISPDVLRQCDFLAKIPILGNIGSLNVSVAAGIFMFEVVRQRNL